MCFFVIILLLFLCLSVPIKGGFPAVTDTEELKGFRETQWLVEFIMFVFVWSVWLRRWVRVCVHVCVCACVFIAYMCVHICMIACVCMCPCVCVCVCDLRVSLRVCDLRVCTWPLIGLSCLHGSQ